MNSEEYTFEAKPARFSQKEILRLEGQVNYTYIYTTIGKFIFAKTLKSFENLLDPKQFVRAHKSHIVNKTHVKSASFSRHSSTLMLKSGIEINVARRRTKEVKEFFKPFSNTLVVR